MTTYLRRQYAGLLAEGTITELSEGRAFPYRLFDVLPKIVLNLTEGKFTANAFLLDPGGTYTVPLPANYDTAERLSVTIRSNNNCKVVLDNGPITSTHLIRGTDDSDDGVHLGILTLQDTVDSLVISVPGALTEDAYIEYFIWEIPDLEDPDNYRIGDRAFGYIVGGNE